MPALEPFVTAKTTAQLRAAALVAVAMPLKQEEDNALMEKTQGKPDEVVLGQPWHNQPLQRRP